jgi:hypothetical protein
MKTTALAAIAWTLAAQAQAHDPATEIVRPSNMISPPQEVLQLRETTLKGRQCYLVTAAATTLISMRQEGLSVAGYAAHALDKLATAGWAADNDHVVYASTTYAWTRAIPSEALDVLLPGGNEAQQTAVALGVMRHCVGQESQ